MSFSTGLGLLLAGASVFLVWHAYMGYPLLLRLMRARREATAPEEPLADAWPVISVVIPAYNEEHTIGPTLENLLAVDYPSDRLQIVVISDASTDRTDEIVQGYAAHGVEFHRMPERRGKTAAENASSRWIRGEIVVNTDASVKIDRNALKPLVGAFRDTSVGVASGRDVSVWPKEAGENSGESGYVGYEMWVRGLETSLGGIVGASGCFFASRASLHRETVPEVLSRDFAAPLIAHERGYRSVSVTEAICYVPRTRSLKREYKRKVRTMTRGLMTLWYKRGLLSLRRHGMFAFMLWNHKLLRWLTPWAGVGALAGMILVAWGVGWLRWALGLGFVVATAIMVSGWRWSPRWPPMPKVLSAAAYIMLGLLAGLESWGRALLGNGDAAWEPTRRDPIDGPHVRHQE